MIKRPHFLNRLGKIGSDTLISAVSLKREVESEALDRLERLAKKLKLVRRDEYEVLQTAVKNLRTIQDGHEARLKAIESQLGLHNSVGKKGNAKKRAVSKIESAKKRPSN